jgi:hypothetical protein
MHKLICTSLLLLSTTSMAANQCDVEFDGQIELEQHVLTIHTKQHKKVMINQDKVLFVNDQKITLTDRQQQRVKEYYDSIYSAVPMAAGIASDALAMASSAINQTFTKLLGADSQVVANAVVQIDSLKEILHDNFYAKNGSIRLYSKQFQDGEFFSEDFTQNLEQAIEGIVTQSIGQIMVSLGTEMLLNGGDMGGFEQRMATFGDEIEQNLEHQGTAFEKRAELFCASLANIDRIEEKLQNEIPQLADMDVLQVKNYAM